MYSVNTTQNSLFLAVLFKVPLFLKSRLEILGASLQLLHPQLLHPVACQMMLIFISMIPWHHAVLVLTLLPCLYSGRIMNCLETVVSLLLFSCYIVSDSFDPMDCSTPGFPLLHHLSEYAQTHIHCVNDAIRPSGGQSIGASASVLPMNIQDWFPFGLTGLISL